jgi:XapX domain-containing protein
MDSSALISLLLALGIGALCRRFDLPLPAPPNPLGALLVVLLTLGYLAGSWF